MSSNGYSNSLLLPVHEIIWKTCWEYKLFNITWIDVAYSMNVESIFTYSKDETFGCYSTAPGKSLLYSYCCYCWIAGLLDADCTGSPADKRSDIVFSLEE